jgi:hypothetical protein
MLRARTTSSVENTFDGKLIQLSDERHYMRAIVDIGIPLNILLNGDELRDQSFMIGDSVRVVCPAESIQLLRFNDESLGGTNQLRTGSSGSSRKESMD